MITLGELKTNITKLLCEYSKNGQLLTEETPSVKDRRLAMDLAIDVSLRKVLTVFGLESSRLDVNGEYAVPVSIPLPEGFAAIEALIAPSGTASLEGAYIADGSIVFTPQESGDYVLVYKRYPQSVAGKDDSFVLSLDAYSSDAVAYAAATELCDVKESELYMRLKYRLDELIANRYNVDKLSAPPFNRVYVAGKRKLDVI